MSNVTMFFLLLTSMGPRAEAFAKIGDVLTSEMTHGQFVMNNYT